MSIALAISRLLRDSGRAMSDFKSISVSDYMSSDVQSVAPDCSLDQAHEKMLEFRLSCLCVVDKGALVGVVSRTDLLRAGRRASHQSASKQSEPRALLLEFASKTVSEVMTRELVRVAPSDALSQASRILVKHGVHRVFVTMGEQLLGVLSTMDIMAAVSHGASRATIEKSMTAPVISVDVNQTLAEATDALQKAKISGLIVTESGWPVGVFTQAEALAAKERDSDIQVVEVMDPAVICIPVNTTMQRACQQAIRMRTRRIVACESNIMRGLLSGLDFAAFVAAESDS